MEKFGDFVMNLMGFSLCLLMCAAVACGILAGSLALFDPKVFHGKTVNTTVVGVVSDKGWNVKPATYWIDIDGTEIDMDESIWNELHNGEKVRLILSNGYAETFQSLSLKSTNHG